MKISELLEAAAPKKVTKETEIIRVLRAAAREINPETWDNFTTTNAKVVLKKNDMWEYNVKVWMGWMGFYKSEKDDPRLRAFDEIQKAADDLYGFSVSIGKRDAQVQELNDGRWLIPVTLYGKSTVTDRLLTPDDDDDETVKALRAKMQARTGVHSEAKKILNVIHGLKTYAVDGISVNGKDVIKIGDVKLSDFKSEFDIVMKKTNHETERKRLLKDQKPTEMQQVVFNGIEALRKSKDFDFKGIRLAKEAMFNPEKATDIPMGMDFTFYYCFGRSTWE